jgi:triacylglycerol lipase
MWIVGRGRWGALAAAVAVVMLMAPARLAVAAAPADPPLSVDQAAVQRSMTCRGPVGGGGREPVLLVHGTFVNGYESFGWNYLAELAARGYRVCMVDLPNRSIDDIQVAAEHVVVAVHRLALESGRKVDVLGHSQGALEVRWAVRWWPSVQAQVDDVVSLAGPNQGTTVAGTLLSSAGGCPACTQMAPTSAFIAALNRGDQTPGPSSFTSIYSTQVDLLITPNHTAARIEGASNLELQALCRGRTVTHATILSDAAAFSLALDAFNRPGPATAAGFDRTACRRVSFVGAAGTLGVLPLLLSPHPAPRVQAILVPEPALKPYARPAVATPPRPPAAARPARPTAPAPAAAHATSAPAAVTAAATATAAPAAGPVRTATADGALAATVVATGVPVAATTVPPADRREPMLLVAALALVLVAGATSGTVARWASRS